MRSSTSSSRAVIAFAVGFLAMVGVGETLPDDLRLETPDTVPQDRDGEFFPTDDGGDDELYYGDPRFFDSYRNADIWLVGNSQIQYDLRRDAMRSFCKKYGVTYFNFGITNMTGELFILRIMRKYDIWPRLVIINEDEFFTGELSRSTRAIVAETWRERQVTVSSFPITWEDLRRSFEAHAGDFVTSRLGAVLPFWRVGRPMLDRIRPMFRSSIDGTWRDYPPVRAMGVPGPIAYSDMEKERHVPGAHVEAARRFARELRAHGTEIVLTVLPHVGGLLPRARQIAEAVDAPLIVPRVENLRTLDSVHLDEDSAKRFSAAFLSELVETAEFRRAFPGARDGASQ